ncbi:ERMES complex subunit [Elasticomyces elasticus]|nr:ERMES complex subunit [Elasticomyces elasticus]
MAFNFNWSPLIADTSRARDMLTTALNKSAKPPIIVDDIIVQELNLGSVPPSLEILEIGDLAEDRFRGIFKMSYSGDAFLVLKTKVQVNPLRTMMEGRGGVRSWTEPGWVAAGGGLTIPISITLSQIRLSGFVILVFSRQKGITLVFRNDPLEGLKVSSTFDSIGFVREYLQKEIEKQLRVLFMEDLPAIIHRLSLRLFVPEYQRQAEDEAEKAARAAGNPSTSREDEQAPIDPLASPPQNPMNDTDFDGAPGPFFLDPSGTETHASFSQKNLLRLAALTESHRTLSLFTPGIRDAVFRAWAVPPGHGLNSNVGTSATWSSNSSETADHSSLPSRPTLSSFSSATTGLTLSSTRSRGHANPKRKRKNRVVDLRKTVNPEKDVEINDTASVSTDYTHSSTSACGASSAASEETPAMPAWACGEREGEISTPPRSPAQKVRFERRKESTRGSIDTPTRLHPNSPTPIRREEKTPSPLALHDPDATPKATEAPPPSFHAYLDNHQSRPSRPRMQANASSSYPAEKAPPLSRSASTARLQSLLEGSSGGILEQAWMMKMATEIARKVREEKERGVLRGGRGAEFWDKVRDGLGDGEGEGEAPPAYVN